MKFQELPLGRLALALPLLLLPNGGAHPTAVLSRNEEDHGALLAQCPGYKASNIIVSESGITADLALAGEDCRAYGDDLDSLRLEVTFETDTRLHVKIEDSARQVYQIPDSILPPPPPLPSSSSSSLLRFNLTEDPFSFVISRAETGEVVFDTSAAPLVFESQYLRLRTRLPRDPNLYGLGEHTDSLRLRTRGYVRTLWNRDSSAVPESENLYGSHPFYMEHRATGSHGVFLKNSNGMDVVVDTDGDDGEQFLEYNTLGGVLDLYFFAGPSPVEVEKQYAGVVGLPANMPYWGFGFQQCRYGYQDLYDVAEVVQNYSNAKIPLETMWTDIDYMDRRRVFSLDGDRFPLAKMRELVDHLHARNQRYVLMVDPAIAYTDYPPFLRGVEDSAFLLRANGSVWKGVVWPGVTAFPDWFSENGTRYWIGEFDVFFNKDSGVDIDAVWIDMNEPSNMGCYFPCDDPDSAARYITPVPPAVRDPPRPLPGWPCDFQPPGSDCEQGREQDQGQAAGVVLPELDPLAAALDSHAETVLLAKKQSVLSEERQLPPRRELSPVVSHMGLPGRDLLYPGFAIHNKEAWDYRWNAAEGGLSNRTVDTDIVHQNGLTMYDTHNVYGLMMSIASREAMLARRPGLRPMVITRSTFSGSGARVGHWLGDNVSSWDHYRASIRHLLGFVSFFQVPMAGPDVCGFIGNTTEELCARWASLGAFAPFYRNHNDLGQLPQEFYRWETVAESARRAIDIRYRLIDYIYTALYLQTRDGTPMLSPVFFVYPHDPATFALDLQYFFGPGLLVAPVVDEGGTAVDVYLPDDLFYDWHTHRPVRGRGASVRVAGQGPTDIPLFVRGGVVIPARVRSAMTTTDLRRNNFELIIAVGRDGTARGELYLDDGVSLEQPDDAVTHVTFEYASGRLVGRGKWSYPTDVRIEKLTLLRDNDDDEYGQDRAAGADGKFSTSWAVDIPLTKEFEIAIPLVV